MMPFIVVLGIAGAILILAGLIGGGFSFSGHFMPTFSVPKVSNWVRLPCCSTGSILVVVAIGLGLVYNPPSFPAPAPDPPATTITPTNTASPAPANTTSPTPGPTNTSSNNIALVRGTIDIPPGDSAAYVYEQPSLNSSIIAELANGDSVGILCTAQGDVVTRSDTGYSTSLWDDTSEGFIPDTYVDTGTNQATMPSC